MMHNIVVVGGGPSGMMAAISARMHHPHSHVTLIERNERLGKKLRYTGGGRCNVTANVSVDDVIANTPKNGKFLYSALHSFGPQDIIAFFEGIGCPLKEEDHHRMFPYDNRSQSIVDALQHTLIRSKVKVMLDTYVEDVDFTGRHLVTAKGPVPFDALILAAGGRILPGSGSDGSGYGLAQKAGHTLTDLYPAEVPLVSNDRFIQEKTLQGLSFKDVSLRLHKGKKISKQITHDLLITHFGLSGPAALRLSFYIQEHLKKEDQAELSIDFLPHVPLQTILEDPEQLAVLPKRLRDYVNEQEPSEHGQALLLKNFPITVYETRGFTHAFVTNGGIRLKEIDPKTLKSKINDRLSLCGELIDINAFTGGYNITCAFSTGYAAGKYCL